ncbi:MAG: M1 family metallopeptidase, partial [Saprospiraceae bacterium]|nr:M1 family metallopeptidase [Saprospiraceae bacterium]
RMEVHLDTESHQFEGKQTLFYTNHSPDTLRKVFYHLYFNAFQPGSMMDIRSQNLPDPDSRVGGKISALEAEEMGYLKVNKLLQDGQETSIIHDETILEVRLATPMVPGDVATLEMTFTGQVPVQIRRSGRDNAEGIAYSMGQWYPKMCAYDEQGWHANPYVAREFYGVWGNYDVKISLNAKYIVAATGTLQNPDDIGFGYSDREVFHKPKNDLTWHFKARNVHDFMWAADPDYKHESVEVAGGTRLHFFYQPSKRNQDAWAALPTVMSKAWPMIEDSYGDYPYDSYSFIQGGDAGMEYPMATLITGERSVGSLIGVAIHEVMHAWFHTLLANNESLYSWMDEGFSTFATSTIMNQLRKDKSIPGEYTPSPFVDLYNGYRNLIKSGREEPLSTHADHFMTNYGYGVASYTKGAVFLKQLEYIVGNETFNKSMLNYYYKWRFRHPNPNDLIRIFEKESDLELDWYREYFVNSIKVIEYGIDAIRAENQTSIVTISKLGTMPMPIDVEVSYKDGSTSMHTIPLKIMRGAKQSDLGRDVQVEPDWPWTNPSYELVIKKSIDKIESVRIDPSLRLADFDLSNNMVEPDDN